MPASDGTKELDGLSFGTKTHEALQPKGLKSIQIPIPSLMDMVSFMLYEKHLDCFHKGHPPNSHKIWLVDEIIKFKIFWRWVF